MQNSSSCYAASKSDSRIWADWSQLERSCNYSWSNSSSFTAQGEASSSQHRSPRSDIERHIPIPMSYSLTPPTPSTTDSDASSSQLSMESIPEYDDMPEIPFVSAAIANPHAWIDDRFPEVPRAVECQVSSSSFWSGIVGIRANTSKSSIDSRAPVLGHTNERVFAPSRTGRKRSGSVSSISSSRTRPAPAKSILSSSDSVKTRRRKAPSVKFLDRPTIHYEEDDPYNEHEPSSCMSPPPPKKAKSLYGFFSFKWLLGTSSNSKSGPAKASATDRPTISGPFPLWDSPPRVRGAYNNGASSASLRSIKSNGSLRSMRSCNSRLPTPTYWPR